MTMRMRGILRGSAAALGAMALVWGTAACTGEAREDLPPDEASGAEQESSPADDQAEGSSAPEVSAPGSQGALSDGGGESPYSDQELAAASQRFVDVLQVLDDQDWEAACGMVLDPTTGTAPEGERLQECVDGVQPVIADQAETLEAGTFDAVDPSMIEASDNGDGTVSLSVLGNDLAVPMTLGDDGSWYLVIPF